MRDEDNVYDRDFDEVEIDFEALMEEIEQEQGQQEVVQLGVDLTAMIHLLEKIYPPFSIFQLYEGVKFVGDIFNDTFYIMFGDNGEIYLTFNKVIIGSIINTDEDFAGLTKMVDLKRMLKIDGALEAEIVLYDKKNNQVTIIHNGIIPKM